MGINNSKIKKIKINEIYTNDYIGKEKQFINNMLFIEMVIQAIKNVYEIDEVYEEMIRIDLEDNLKENEFNVENSIRELKKVNFTEEELDEIIRIYNEDKKDVNVQISNITEETRLSLMVNNKIIMKDGVDRLYDFYIHYSGDKYRIMLKILSYIWLLKNKKLLDEMEKEVTELPKGVSMNSIVLQSIVIIYS